MNPGGQRRRWEEVPANRAVAESTLLRLWSRIEEILRTVGEGSSGLRAEEASLIERWVKLFRDEIVFIRDVRNGVAHAALVGEENLNAAVSYAQDVLQLLEYRLKTLGLRGIDELACLRRAPDTR